MKKTLLALILSLLLPSLCPAENNETPPAAWIVYQQQEKLRIANFYKQLKADRQAFLNANPDVKAYLTHLSGKTTAGTTK